MGYSGVEFLIVRPCDQPCCQAISVEYCSAIPLYAKQNKHFFGISVQDAEFLSGQTPAGFVLFWQMG